MNNMWKYAKKIWGFCELYGNLNTDWAKLIRERTILAETAAEAVKSIIDGHHDAMEI